MTTFCNRLVPTISEDNRKLKKQILGYRLPALYPTIVIVYDLIAEEQAIELRKANNDWRRKSKNSKFTGYHNGK